MHIPFFVLAGLACAQSQISAVGEGPRDSRAIASLLLAADPGGAWQISRAPSHANLPRLLREGQPFAASLLRPSSLPWIDIRMSEEESSEDADASNTTQSEGEAEDAKEEADTSEEEAEGQVEASEIVQAEVSKKTRFLSKAWFKKWASFDKKNLKTLGLDAFLTYGFVSNANAGITTAIAWTIFSRSTGLSPLAPDQWKKFLGVYAGVYLSLGSVLRPFRMALAVALTPTYEKLLTKIRGSLPLRVSRPKVNRALGILVMTFALNICATLGIIGFGASLASLISGVPMFPPGWKMPFAA